jgi:sorting nexin-25
MELSRRDVILAILSAFISWGYLTHWVPSLRFLPYAFIAGFVCAVLLTGWALFRARKRTSIDFTEIYGVSHVSFVEPQNWSTETDAWRRRCEYHPKTIYPPSKKVSQSLDKLLELLLRDFISSWYSQISKRPEFKNEVDKAIRVALISIMRKLMELDIVGLVISRLVPIVTTHMNDFYQAERTVRGRKLTRNITESEGLDLAIAAKFRNGNLHKAASLAFADSTLVEQQYLRNIIARIVPLVLPTNMLSSPAVTVLIKEIVSCAVLVPGIRLLAEPDTWHQILEVYGQNVLQERKNVRKLRAALEEHTPQVSKSPKQVPLPKLHPQDNEKKFERFIRAIRKCYTLSDARRFRSEVAIQLRKESAVEGQDPLYLRRLETGKQMLDQRIAQLGAAGSTPRKVAATAVKEQRTRSVQYEATTLRDILYNASGLSYFMEYMDRQNLMRLVQFWIVVDGFRNPLEDDNEEYVNDGTQEPWTTSDRNDLAQINEAYLSKPEIKISPIVRERVKSFLRAGKQATNAQYHTARQAVLQTQTNAYDEMLDPHFVGFKKSDLWFKFLAAKDAVVSPVSKVVRSEQLDGPTAMSNRQNKSARGGAGNLASKPPDLRRAIASASDLRATGKPENSESNVRKSLDIDYSSARAPLFDDDLDSDPLARSTASLDSDQDANGTAVEDPNVVDAMQLALNNIMEEEEPDKDKLFSDHVIRSGTDDDSLRGSMDLPRPSSLGPKRDREKPSIASLGLVDAMGRRGVFEEDLFGDETKFAEDDKDDLSQGEGDDEDEIHEAAPGDLGLAEAIDALTLDIEKLVTQESIVDSLTKKAELTNNAAELRILRKSKASLQREISRKELQRQQYIIQESDNSLYGRANVRIKSIMVGTDEDGREFAMCMLWNLSNTSPLMISRHCRSHSRSG